MGYTIMIGEAICVAEGAEDENEYRVFVRGRASAQAPAFDQFNRHRNQSWPAYAVWRDFARRVGLEAFFYDKQVGLMREHPGCFRLLPVHLEQLTEAVKAWEATHTGLPGWADGQDPALARLVWLHWWTEWALRDCENPAIANR